MKSTTARPFESTKNTNASGRRNYNTDSRAMALLFRFGKDSKSVAAQRVPVARLPTSQGLAGWGVMRAIIFPDGNLKRARPRGCFDGKRLEQGSAGGSAGQRAASLSERQCRRGGATPSLRGAAGALGLVHVLQAARDQRPPSSLCTVPQHCSGPKGGSCKRRLRDPPVCRVGHYCVALGAGHRGTKAERGDHH